MITPEQKLKLDEMARGLGLQVQSTKPSAFDEIDSLLAKQQTESKNITPFNKFNQSGTNQNKDELKDSFLGGIDQIKLGSEEIAKGIQTGSLQEVGKGVLSGAAGGLNTVFAPIATVFNTITGNKFPEFIDSISKSITENEQTLGKSKFHTNESGVLGQLYNTLVNNPTYQKFAMENPDAGKVFNDLLTIGTSFIGGEAPKVLKGSLGGLAEITTPVVKSIDDVLNSAKRLKDDIQLTVAKKNVNPQLESSANRLFLDGTKRLDSPIATYDKYLEQSKKALNDIRIDPAISEVGSKMGDAFDTVVKQRQSVGKVLGKELKANGKIKIDISDTRSNLLNELDNSGLSYNPKTNELTSFQGSRFAPEEVSMLNDFVKSLNTLGDNPTVSQIDNFIAKTRTTLDFTKGKSGVMGTTNAERIINGGVAKLKETLNPSVNGNTALSKYWRANNAYSRLSDFIDEGSTFLGKKTLSGDYAKDASVAKNSVQSILNQGKKDFMIKLEALTGYPAIDDAVLALQAMKDAGDFRGLSLLQAMSDSGGIPTSKAGFTQQILDYTVKKGGEFVAGTPEQQTRALLQDLSNKAQNAKPTNTKAKTRAKVGDKTNNINQSNNNIK